MWFSRGSVLEDCSSVVVVSDIVGCGWSLENKDLVHAKKPCLGAIFVNGMLSGPSEVVIGRTGMLGLDGTGMMVVTPRAVLLCESPSPSPTRPPRFGIDL